MLKANGWRLTTQGGELSVRAQGHDWPPTAETMVGRQRLADVRWCIDQVMTEAVPGDFIETGVWRGGVTILMRGMLEAWGDNERRVWFADTLSAAPMDQLAILRLDGDLYESTMDALTALYPKLSVGGYVLVDDYRAWEALPQRCRRTPQPQSRRPRSRRPLHHAQRHQR